MLKTAHIRFGQFIFAYLCESQEVLDFFKSYFNVDSSESFPDVLIKVTVLPDAETPSIKQGARYSYSVDNEIFNFGPNLIQGCWDAPKKTCHLVISKTILNTEEIWLLNRVLCRIFYSMFDLSSSEAKKAVIVHSSGIRRGEKGYIFFGPSGSGKSTIAQFSNNYEVLHDDMNIVFTDMKNAFVMGIPYNPNQLEFTNRSSPVSMIFSLHQSDEVRIEHGTRDEFTKMVLPEVFLPLPLLSEDRKAAFQYLLNSVKELGECVPYYRLYFKRDESFWNLIEEMEGIHGRHQEVLD